MTYLFLDANASILTAASSINGGVNFPQVYVVGSVTTVTTGSILSFQAGTQISSISGTVTVASIVSTYAEDAAAASGDAGLQTLGVRNDTLSSVTSADRDYTAASYGPVGEAITANAPLTKWVQGSTSVMYGGSVTAIAAQGSSIFTYITSAQIVNASANNAYVTFFGATSSVIAYVPAPANSGAIPLMTNGWKSNANGAIFASISGVASVYLSLQGFISKT